MYKSLLNIYKCIKLLKLHKTDGHVI